MDKNKEKLFDVYHEDEIHEQDGDESRQWLHTPERKVVSGEEADDGYHEEELKIEPSKYSITDHEQGVFKRRKLPRRHAHKVIKAQDPQSKRSHISSRRVGKKHRRKQKHWSLRITMILLPTMLSILVYQHLNIIQTLSEPLLGKIDKLVKRQRSGGDKGKSYITALSDADDAQQTPLTLAEMDCHDLIPRAKKISNMRGLEFEAQFAIAECYYLRGNYVDSYLLLHKNKQRLYDESLLLYTILLLKRRQFRAVTTLVRNKCQRVGGERSFFPCLAQALQRLVQSGDIAFNIEPGSAHRHNPYSAIAWMLLALRNRTYHVNSEHLSQAITVGKRSNRRVALSYVYETLMRYAYRYGSKESVEELLEMAMQDLHDEHAAASWWTHYIARIRLAETRKRENLHIISNKDNQARMYNNLDFLSIIGMESIRLSYSDALGTIFNRIWQYQKRTWGAAAKESLRFIDQWKIRIKLSNAHDRDAVKNMKVYANNYGQDYFYCFFRGIATMNMTGKSGKRASPTALISRSLSLHDSWETNYAYALVLMKGGKDARFAKHMHKLKSLAITPVHKNWLFLLRAEIKISTGKHDAAIADLRNYISTHTQSFAAHRLLASAYISANKRKEAGVVRMDYDRLQKSVPYYSTEEGMTSPVGPFALLHL